MASEVATSGGAERTLRRDAEIALIFKIRPKEWEAEEDSRHASAQ